MFDIITFGSAIWDIFFKPRNFKILKNKESFISGKGICFNIGSKIDVEDIKFSSGGGGTNTAATFARQGFKTAFCGQVGDDLSGKEIVSELKKLGVDARFIRKTKLKPTNHSIVISHPNIDRTILVYRGASEILEKKDIPWYNLKAKWFYLAPLSGKLGGLTEALVDFAYKNKINIAFNPGNTQISLPEDTLKKIIKKVNILILNQEEASLLTKVPYQKEKQIFKKIDEICPGIAIMTKGAQGVTVSDGKKLYSAKPEKIKVADRTGAGDSFASGFVSGFIQSKGDIEYAIQLGLANSTSCLKKWGAKEGLLKKVAQFKKVKISKKTIL